jgi:hypothetical protein
MDELRNLVSRTLDQAAPDSFTAASNYLRSIYSPGAVAILGYGSCIRNSVTSESILDLYVLTRDIRHVSPRLLSRIGCKLAPPNVYYAEVNDGTARVRLKYAVMPMADFARRMKVSTKNPYFWGRFSQPVRLIWAETAEDRQAVIQALAEALRTMFANSIGLTTSTDTQQLFAAGFAATYSTELRPESSLRAAEIVESNQPYFVEAARILAGTPPLRVNWSRRRFIGKLLSLVRLTKAVFTFAGGVDYAAWKIGRHTGQSIEITDWNRRHPLLSGIIFLPRLLRRSSIR